MRLANIFKTSSVYLAGDLARRGLGFLMIPLYTQYLSPSDYGLIELIELFVMIAGICFGLGAINDAMVRIYHEQTEDKERFSVVATAVLLVAVFSAAITLVAASAALPLSRYAIGSERYAGLIRASFVALGLSSLSEIALVYQRLRMRAVFFITFSGIQLAANLALNIYFIAFAGKGVWGFVLAKVIVMGAGSIFLLIHLFREVGYRLSKEAAIKIRQFAAPLVPSGAAFFVLHFADRFFVKHFGGLSAVGTYALAYKFGFLVTYLVGQPFGSVWSVSLYGHTNRAQWRGDFARVATYLAFFLTFVAMGLGLFIDKAFPLIAPPSYATAASLVVVIAFGYAFREMGDFFRGVLFINKRVRVFSQLTVTCAVLNLILDWILIGKYQAAGAAWATLATWLAYMSLCWFLAYREHRIPFHPGPFVQLILSAAACCALSVLLKPASRLWQLAGSMALMLLFLAANWALGYFNRHERTLIVQQLLASRSLFEKPERVPKVIP